MASTWTQFRDSVSRAATRVGEHEVKNAVADKLQSRGYTHNEAARVSNSLVSKARTNQPYDPNDPDMIEVTGYRDNIGAKKWLVPALLAGAGVVALSLLRRR